jgi:hypothetical protein
MKVSAWGSCGLLLWGSLLAWAQSGSGEPAPPVASSSVNSAKSDGISASALEHDFFAVLRKGDGKQFLAYVPDDGVNIGREEQPTTRAEIQDQFTHRTGLYCKLFDSTCIRSAVKLDAGAQPCSYRELLTQSEKVRTASTETTRNGVRQAILVAEVHNQKCPGPALIDFIFNYHQSGWKLFSIP